MRRLRQPDMDIGTFVDMAEVGNGSFARVFRAVDQDTGQHVALKVLDLQTSRAANRDLFRLEARALAALSAHPHIVTLYRAFISREGAPVLVMELCETSLSAVTSSNGVLSPQAATSVVVKLAGALATAHAKGILHRDLKPANVLITRYGEPALSDFGVAQMRNTASAASPASAITLYHAAPEIILGGPSDERSDLYSLASTLYELLAGHPPFYVTADEDPLVVQRRVLTDAAPRIRSNDLPFRLQDLLHQALAKQPEARPPTVVAFARLLRDVEEADGWPATPCLVEGRSELPSLPGAPDVHIPSDRAASNTSVPPLGVDPRPFASVELPERRLKPVERPQLRKVSSDRPVIPLRRTATPPSGSPDTSPPAAPAATEPGGLLQQLAEHAEHSGTDSPATSSTAAASLATDDIPAETDPSARGLHPVRAVWGYGAEGATGTVVRRNTSPPSPANVDPAPSKRRRFGRKRTT